MNILQGLGSMLTGRHGGGGTIQVTVVQARRLARKDVLCMSISKFIFIYYPYH